MAIVLKQGKTFNPSLSARFGVDMTGSNYYGVVDHYEINKKEKQCFFRIEIYGTSELRGSEDATVVDALNFIIKDDDFDSVVTNDGLKIPDLYAHALETLTDWESDEA